MLREKGCGMEFRLAEIFNADECDLCGDCLASCPLLAYSREEARDAIRGLIAGDPASPVLKRCSTCMSCNTHCHRSCNPYGLILYRWFERYRDRRIPIRSTLVMPLEPRNAWWTMKRWFPEDEQAKLAEWEDFSRPAVSAAEEVMFAGCNLLSYPYLVGEGIFDDLPVVGAEGLCCGEVYFRMGLLDAWERNARTLPARLAPLRGKRLVAWCQACYNIMKNVMPSYLGISLEKELDLEFVYVGDWLSARLDSGALELPHPVNLSLAVHEPCHAKTLGDDFMRTPRALFEACGGTVLEMEHHHKDGLCCGFGCGASRYSPFDLVLGGLKRLREARGLGKGIMVYCNSCLLFLSMARLMYPGAPRLYHLAELLQQAAGFPIDRRHERRVLHFVAELTRGTPRMLSPKRVEI